MVGLPFGIDANALYYRKDLFEKAGIRDLPETMNELESVLRQLKAVYPEKVPFLFAAGIDADSTDVTQFFMEVNGGSAVTKEYTSAFQSKNNLDSFAYLERWVKDGLVSSDAVRYETEDAEKIFLADGACIILTSMRAGWLRNSDLYEICGVMGNITGNQVVNGYVTYSPQAYHGFSQTDHPEESRVFLKWLIENNLPLFTEGNSGIVPIRTSYQEELGRDDETLQIIMRNIGRYGRLYTYPFDSVQPFHSSLDGENIQTIPVTEILTGSDAVEALAKADQAFRKILDEEK